MIPNDTLLAKFVRNFGDETLSFLVGSLYPSSVFKIVLFSSAVVMLLSTAISLHRGRVQRYVYLFWISWLMAIPVQNKPLFYIFINNFSALISLQLQKVTYDLFTHFGTKKTYPPGFVAETLVHAATSKITDPPLSSALGVVINNCVPFGTIENRPINASDLFRVKIRGSVHEATSFELPFEASLLKNRKIRLKDEETDCHRFLLKTLSSLYSHINSKEIARAGSKLYVGSSNKDLEHRWVQKWTESDYRSSPLGKTALNLAAASAVQAQVLNHYFGSDLKFNGNRFVNGNTSPLIDMQKNLLSFYKPSRVIFNLKNLPSSVMRAFNTDHYLDNAENLIQLNKKLLDMPYYISTIQVFLKIVFPLIMLTPFILGSWKILLMWGVSYTTCLIIPWLMMISRSICNIVLIHSLKIESTAARLSSDPSYLRFGIDFSAASNMLEDTGRFLNTYLSTENGLWGSIIAIVPIISWFAAGSSGKSTSSGITQGVQNRATQMIASRGVSGMSELKDLSVSKMKVVSSFATRNHSDANKSLLENLKKS